MSLKDLNTLIKNKISKLGETGFFHIFGSSVINKILAFISGILVVRVISKTEFGIYSYALNQINIILLLSGIGMVSSVFQIASENSGNDSYQNKVYGYGTKWGYLFNVFLTAGIIIYAMLGKFKYIGASRLILMMGFYPFTTLIFQFQQIFLRSKLLNKEFSYSNTLNTVLVVGGSIIGALCGGAFGLILGTYTANILSIIIVALQYKAPVFTRESIQNSKEKKDIWKIALVSAVNNGISQLINYIDVFFVGLYILNPEVLASYKVATTIPLALYFVPTCVITYIYPMFAKNKDNGKWTRDNYKKLVLCLGGVNLLGSIILILIAPVLIPVIFGSQYSDAIPYFVILMIGYFFYGTFKSISGNLLVTQRRLSVNFVAGIISLCICFVGNMVLLPRIGALGSAWINTVSNIVVGLFMTLYYWRLIKKI